MKKGSHIKYIYFNDLPTFQHDSLLQGIVNTLKKTGRRNKTSMHILHLCVIKSCTVQSQDYEEIFKCMGNVNSNTAFFKLADQNA